jgi:hypothetical protein
VANCIFKRANYLALGVASCASYLLVRALSITTAAKENTLAVLHCGQCEPFLEKGTIVIQPLIALRFGDEYYLSQSILLSKVSFLRPFLSQTFSSLLEKRLLTFSCFWERGRISSTFLVLYFALTLSSPHLLIYI